MLSPLKADLNLDYSRQCILRFLEEFSHGILLDSNSSSLSPIPVTGVTYDFLAAAGHIDEFTGDANSLDALQEFIDYHQLKKNYIFGYISYDVKNGIENLHSLNIDHLNFPEIYFFVPEHVIISRKGKLEVISKTADPDKLKEIIFHNLPTVILHEKTEIQFSHVINREQYLSSVKMILEHIQRGDIYELNYCHQFVGTSSNFTPANVFGKLMTVSPNPFSTFLKLKSRYLLSASPERFIAKSGSKLISQPIKGTAARGMDALSDENSRNQLRSSTKERSENVMIVDLVRNDLSKIATKGSVNVDDLFGVYTFPRSHQMISTVSCNLKEGTSFTTILRSVFPMGSMTGAPKVSAMKLIEKYENFKRGLFSGTVGYIDPESNFDFNVVIRSILYNAETKTVTFAAGGAITAESDPVREYDETLLKLSPQLHAMGVDMDQLLNLNVT